MKNANKILYIIIASLLIILALSIRSCDINRKHFIESDKALTSQKLDNQSFRQTVTKQGQKIFSQEQIMLVDRKVIKEQMDKIEGLSKVKTQIKIETRTEVVKIEVPIDNPIYIKDSLGKKYLLTPSNFKVADEWYDISGVIGDEGNVNFDRVSFKNKTSVYIGLKKRTFKEFITFKKRERTISIIDANPYTTVNRLNNFSVVERKRLFSIGMSGGYAITPVGIQPYLGVGVNINLIRF